MLFLDQKVIEINILNNHIVQYDQSPLNRHYIGIRNRSPTFFESFTSQIINASNLIVISSPNRFFLDLQC